MRRRRGGDEDFGDSCELRDHSEMFRKLYPRHLMGPSANPHALCDIEAIVAEERAERSKAAGLAIIDVEAELKRAADEIIKCYVDKLLAGYEREEFYADSGPRVEYESAVPVAEKVGTALGDVKEKPRRVAVHCQGDWLEDWE